MIHQFYAGRTILLTGGTGFLGQGLVAKILRDLPEVRRLYLLLRPRRQRDGTRLTAAQRLEAELFAADVFAAFRSEDPAGFARARERTRAVDFDMAAPGLGISAAVRAELLAEVDCIIGTAATVVFDEPLDRSVRVNTLGPLQLLELAHQCRKPVVYVHVSTAYVSGRRRGEIAEEPLPVDRTVQQLMSGADGTFDPAAEIDSCLAFCEDVRARGASAAQTAILRREVLSQGRNRQLGERRLGRLVEDRRKRWVERQLTLEGTRRAELHGWNDVYTFTKAMGEQMLTRQRGAMPLVIVRPSIVESSLQDPRPGWVYGLKVADPLIVGYGRGLVPDFPTPRDVVMDLVPVDVVVNTILAAATEARDGQVQVFHAATSGTRPLVMQHLYGYVREYFQQHPMLTRGGEVPVLPEWSFPSAAAFMRRFRWRYLYPLRVQQWLLDRAPERLVPAGRKRRLAALEKRLQRVLYYTELFGPYTRLDCRYSIARSRALAARLPEEERRLFPMDVAQLDWRQYLQEVHIPGLRRHVLREEDAADGLLQDQESAGEMGGEGDQ